MHSFALIPLLAFAGIVSAIPIPAPAPQLILPLLGDVGQDVEVNVKSALGLVGLRRHGFDPALCSRASPTLPCIEGATSSVVDEFVGNAPGANILGGTDLLSRAADAVAPSARSILEEGAEGVSIADDVNNAEAHVLERASIASVLDLAAEQAAAVLQTVKDKIAGIVGVRSEGTSIADYLNAEGKNDVNDAEARVFKQGASRTTGDLEKRGLLDGVLNNADVLGSLGDIAGLNLLHDKRTDAPSPQLVKILLSLLIDNGVIDLPTAKSIALTSGDSLKESPAPQPRADGASTA